MKISAIYKIQSKLKPERCYVGSAVNINSRWEAHKRTLRLDKHHSQQLQRHVGKYGIEDLVFIIIEPCFPEFLIIREQYYIDTLKPYFNSCKIAGSTLGIRYKLSEETRKKISLALKERKFKLVS
jgi:group I intron endonuclease